MSSPYQILRVHSGQKKGQTTSEEVDRAWQRFWANRGVCPPSVNPYVLEPGYGEFMRWIMGQSEHLDANGNIFRNMRKRSQ